VDSEVAEFRDFMVGRDIFERFDDEAEGLGPYRGLDLLTGLVSDDDGGSTKRYKPDSGSASGADWMRVCNGKPAEATKSLPENLSRSITVKLIV
jgi:hypothetical protein